MTAKNLKFWSILVCWWFLEKQSYYCTILTRCDMWCLWMWPVTWEQIVHSAQSSQGKRILGGAWDVKEWLWLGAELLAALKCTVIAHNILAWKFELGCGHQVKTWAKRYRVQWDYNWQQGLHDAQVVYELILCQLMCTTQGKKMKNHIFCDILATIHSGLWPVMKPLFSSVWSCLWPMTEHPVEMVQHQIGQQENCLWVINILTEHWML